MEGKQTDKGKRKKQIPRTDNRSDVSDASAASNPINTIPPVNIGSSDGSNSSVPESTPIPNPASAIAWLSKFPNYKRGLFDAIYGASTHNNTILTPKVNHMEPSDELRSANLRLGITTMGFGPKHLMVGYNNGDVRSFYAESLLFYKEYSSDMNRAPVTQIITNFSPHYFLVIKDYEFYQYTYDSDGYNHFKIFGSEIIAFFYEYGEHYIFLKNGEIHRFVPHPLESNLTFNVFPVFNLKYPLDICKPLLITQTTENSHVYPILAIHGRKAAIINLGEISKCNVSIGHKFYIEVDKNRKIVVEIYNDVAFIANADNSVLNAPAPNQICVVNLTKNTYERLIPGSPLIAMKVCGNFLITSHYDRMINLYNPSNLMLVRELYTPYKVNNILYQNQILVCGTDDAHLFSVPWLYHKAVCVNCTNKFDMKLPVSQMCHHNVLMPQYNYS